MLWDLSIEKNYSKIPGTTSEPKLSLLWEGFGWAKKKHCYIYMLTRKRTFKWKPCCKNTSSVDFSELSEYFCFGFLFLTPYRSLLLFAHLYNAFLCTALGRARKRAKSANVLGFFGEQFICIFSRHFFFFLELLPPIPKRWAGKYSKFCILPTSERSIFALRWSWTKNVHNFSCRTPRSIDLPQNQPHPMRSARVSICLYKN